MRKKIISLLICIGMMLAAFCGCSGGSDPKESGPAGADTSLSGTTSDSQPADTTSTSEALSFNGYAFSISGYREGVWSASTINAKAEAINNIYSDIEDKYDCTITFLPESSKEAVVTAGVSNERIADFLFTDHKVWGVAAVNKLLRPLGTDEVKQAGLDIFDPEIANQDLREVGVFLGENYILPFENSMFVQFSHIVVFNKTLCTAAGYPAETIYSAVKSYAWDWNMFNEIAAAVSQDPNGDGEYEIQGLCKIRDSALLTTNGYEMVSYNAQTGKYYSAVAVPEFQKNVEFWLSLYINPDVYYEPADNWASMLGGTAAFGMFPATDFGTTGLNSRMEDDYGIIPLPKGPDATKYTHCIDELFGFFMQNTNADWKTSCAIMAEIAKGLNDPDGARELVTEFCRDDEQAVEILYTYVYPQAKMRLDNLADFCTCNALGMDVLEMGPATACEKWTVICQSAIDDFFGY